MVYVLTVLIGFTTLKSSSFSTRLDPSTHLQHSELLPVPLPCAEKAEPTLEDSRAAPGDTLVTLVTFG